MCHRKQLYFGEVLSHFMVVCVITDQLVSVDNKLKWLRGKSVCRWSCRFYSSLIPCMVKPMTLALVFKASLPDAQQ